MLRLDLDIVRQYAEQKYGSTAGLATELGLDRSTVSRWLKPPGDSFPKYRNQVLDLAVALDLDPLLVLDLNRTSYLELCRAIEEAVTAGRWWRFPSALKSLSQLVAPSRTWPPPALARPYRREWTVVSFTHTAEGRRNYYEQLVFSEVRMRAAWHFAYRDIVEERRGLWHPYGVVDLAPARVRLLTFRGIWAEAPLRARSGPSFMVETFFGPRAAEFRIASLHPFKCATANSTGSLPTVRFP